MTLGVLPPFVPWDELCGQVQNEYPESELHLLSADRQQQCVLLITHKAATAPVLELLRGRGFAASPLKGRTGTPEENRRRDADRLAEVKRQQEALRKQLDELAERLPELYLCADRLASRLQREENRRRLLTDGCIVAFDGWVPEKKTARLTAYLDTADCDYTLSDPTTEQIPEVPVLLEDNAVARSMNCITEQYSLPAYDGVDPNPVMAPFFILFFGMMMADIGYGLLMLLGSWLFLKKKRPDDRSFMEMIFWCGVTTVVFGAMTGSFFGDFLPQLFKFFDPESTFALPALFSPLDDTMAIMVGSLILGALQVFTGMTVSVVEKCKKGCFMDALFDEITWWIILAGTGQKGLRQGDGLRGGGVQRRDGFLQRYPVLRPADGADAVRRSAGPGVQYAGRHHRQRGHLHHHRIRRQYAEPGAEPAGLLRPRYAPAISGIFRTLLQGRRQGLPSPARPGQTRRDH